MSEAEADRRSSLESWVIFSVTDVGEAITDVETALSFASGLQREQLHRAKAALMEAARHLDTIYPPDEVAAVRVLRQP